MLHLKVLDINPTTDEWMILACDGIWNFMSSQEVLPSDLIKIFSGSLIAKLQSILSAIFKVVDYKIYFLGGRL